MCGYVCVCVRYNMRFLCFQCISDQFNEEQEIKKNHIFWIVLLERLISSE